jgi:hypothetical protein
VLLVGAGGWLEVGVDKTDLRRRRRRRPGVHELDAERDIGPLVFRASTFRTCSLEEERRYLAFGGRLG